MVTETRLLFQLQEAEGGVVYRSDSQGVGRSQSDPEMEDRIQYGI